MGDQVARFEHGFAMRRIAGQDMEVREWNGDCAVGSLHMNRGLQRREGDAHVGRVRGDAVIARAEDREHAIVASDRRTTAAGLAFIARHRRIAEVNAPRSLQQVAGRRRHVANLGGRARQNGLRQHRIVALDCWIVRERRIANHGANS